MNRQSTLEKGKTSDVGKADYIFDKTEERRERERLKAIERYHDPATRRRLLDAGLRAGWRCLEVGPGAGSIMRWMAKVVGTKGQVMAVDINPRFVTPVRSPNVQIVHGDMTKVPLPKGTIHLVHARHTLIHIPNYREAFRRILAALRPGGWIVFEEPDFSAARPVSGRSLHCRAVERVNQAILRMFLSGDKDPAFGAKLPGLLQWFGLHHLTVEHDVPLVPGGSPIATIMKLSAHQLRVRYLATGAVKPGDLVRYRRFAEDPHSWAVYYATVAVRAQKT